MELLVVRLCKYSDYNYDSGLAPIIKPDGGRHLGKFPVVFISHVKMNNHWYVFYPQQYEHFSYETIIRLKFQILFQGHTMLPLFAQPHIIALVPSNQKSFTFYGGFGKSAWL